jgi:hypothetical protein
MNAAISLASVLACAFSLDAQITATLNRLPDGSTQVNVRNDAAVSLSAFALSVNYVSERPTSDAPIVVYVDPVIDMFPAANLRVERMATGPLLPNQEFTMLPEHMIAVSRLGARPLFDQPITAGIFADGKTTGDTALLSRLMLRRSNMLLAVDTTLESLAEAGRHNVPRDQLIKQFRKMVDSMDRWYVPSEQQVGSRLYQSMIGKLMDLPEVPAGSPFPPTPFVERETAMLTLQRATLSESQPSLAVASMVKR